MMREQMRVSLKRMPQVGLMRRKHARRSIPRGARLAGRDRPWNKRRRPKAQG
jgi:hypothetical protein